MNYTADDVTALLIVATSGSLKDVVPEVLDV